MGGDTRCRRKTFEFLSLCMVRSGGTGCVRSRKGTRSQGFYRFVLFLEMEKRDASRVRVRMERGSSRVYGTWVGVLRNVNLGRISWLFSACEWNCDESYGGDWTGVLENGEGLE